MSVRDQISRLETLLQRIQSHSRARRQAALGERRVVLESYTNEAPTASIEVVENAPFEAIDEDDVVEMSSDVLESVPPPAVASSASSAAPPASAPAPPPDVFRNDEISGSDLDFEDEEETEQAPASSKRHRITSTIDDVVSAAEREPRLTDEGREIPLKTPPPESGPQEAPLPTGSLAPAGTPDLGDLLDDLPIEEASAARPRPEQLGETIELVEPLGPPLELDAGASSIPPPPVTEVAEELEVTLPLGRYAGNYEEGLLPPPEAQKDLLEHRRKSGEVLFSPAAHRSDEPEVSYKPPPNDLSFQPPALEQVTVPVPRSEESLTMRGEPTQIAVRSSLSGLSAAEFSGASVRSQAPKSFVELLDESVRLGGT